MGFPPLWLLVHQHTSKCTQIGLMLNLTAVLQNKLLKVLPVGSGMRQRVLVSLQLFNRTSKPTYITGIGAELFTFKRESHQSNQSGFQFDQASAFTLF